MADAILDTVRQWQVIAAVRNNIALIRNCGRQGAAEWEIEVDNKLTAAWAQRFDDLRGYVRSHAPELLPLLPPVYIYDLANCDARVIAENMLKVEAGLLAKAAASDPAATGKAGDTMAEMLDRLSLAIGADSNKIIQIVNSKNRAEDKARAICEIDMTHWAKKSPYWAKLLGVTESAIKKTKFWREERPRHFADATALWKSENPDTELPRELRQWDENDND